MFAFSEGEIFSLREVMQMPTSISAFSYVLNNSGGELFASNFLGLNSIPNAVAIIEAVKWSVIIFSLTALSLKASLTRDVEIILLLVVVITNLGTSTGGYALIFYVPLIPVFIRMRFKMLYMVFLSLMAIPLDTVPLIGYYNGENYSFLSDSYVRVDWTFGLGSLLRPFINIMMLATVSLELFLRKSSNVVHEVIIPEQQYRSKSCSV
jgi:hypothetical protein